MVIINLVFNFPIPFNLKQLLKYKQVPVVHQTLLKGQLVQREMKRTEIKTGVKPQLISFVFHL